ncbi:MAG: ester cyclase [Acidobacteriota bacterium]|jgi:predicted SnoaL-like aldol condensation-catalyzing enzyme|nr:ester cyclase [Acidobacteriota bacterium]NLT33336.1 ester cyclase [Acidobacteriota bacterium]
MNPECNKRLILDFYEEVLCGRNLEAAPRFLHDDYVQHNPHAAQGIAGFQEFHRGFFSAIPDARVTVNMMAAEGDLVFVHGTYTGTHTGEGFLDLPPTGNRVCYDVVDIFRVRDGKLAEHWDVADTRAIFTQLGALPPLP